MPLVAVETEEQKEKFQQILSKGWEENNWDMLPINGENFLFENKKNEYFATLSILRYQPEVQSFINDIFEFDKVEPIKSNQHTTVELDNFTVTRSKRGLRTLIKCFKEGSQHILNKKDVEYCIGVVKPSFYKTINLLFKGYVVALTEEPIYVERDDCYFVPICFDVKKARKSLKRLNIVKKEEVYINR